MALQTHLYFAYQTNLFYILKIFLFKDCSILSISPFIISGCELRDEQILIQILKIGIVLKVS